jgi:hypothetical protein
LATRAQRLKPPEFCSLSPDLENIREIGGRVRD